MTKVRTELIRATFSRLAEIAQGKEFKAEVITFAESAPSKNPKSEGWEKIEVPTLNPKELVDYLAKVDAKEIWYKNATLGGGHKVYVKR